MRKKEERIVVTFHTTADAMAMEKACAGKSKGRLIPVPRQLSAGCGIAFSAPPEEKELLMELLKAASIHEEQFAEGISI